MWCCNMQGIPFTSGRLQGLGGHGDHTESVEIEYDPSEVSYETLLTLFWNNHDPFSPRKRQYMSAIFYHNEEQKHLAEESMKVAQSKSKRKVVTQILPAERFYDAEDYHQKYILQQHRRIFSLLGFNEEDLFRSHVAARLNGYIGGYGTVEKLKEEIGSWGLSKNLSEAIIEIVRKKGCSGLFCGR